MKNQTIIPAIFLLLFLLLLPSCIQNGKPGVERELGEQSKAFYGIEMDDQLCGYKELTCSKVLTDQGEMYQMTEKSHVRMLLMGKRVITSIQNETFFDTSFRHLFYSASTIDQGKMHIKSQITIRGDTAFITASTNKEDKEVPLPPDIHFENGMYKPGLIHAFNSDTSLPLKLKFFNEVKSTVDTKTYRWKTRDTLHLVDKTYYTVCLEEVNHSSGEHSELWIEEHSGFLVQVIFHTSGIKLFLAPRDITGRLVSAKVDDILFYQVHEVIPDFKTLSYMKVHMVINSSGDSLTAEGLNYPGQTFTGNVDNNIIDGIFEIRQQKYEESDAPAYPYDYDLDSSLNVYLEPEFLIESDHPKIKKKAEQIVGSDMTDSWEAVKRLSYWVGTEIKGAIPGGGSAKGTLDQKEGECGGHSRLLVAFCRSLGIPARLSVGCMYVPDNGGFFGQHAWTEVYMGEAGWIPVDATIKEFDYIDSGHIRLAEFSSFHPQKVEILEYETESKKVTHDKRDKPEEE